MARPIPALRDTTEPRPVSFTINFAFANSDFTTSTVSSVQPSAVMSTSRGVGFNCRRTRHVRHKSAARFFVVIITETVMNKRWFPSHQKSCSQCR